MIRNPNSIRNTKRLIIAVLALLVLCVVVFIRFNHFGTPRLVRSQLIPTSESKPDFDLSDPEPSFGVLKYVVRNGGEDRTRDAAIIWLDNLAHAGERPLPEVENWLLNMIRENGNPAWDTEYMLWLFNSAFNVLHFGENQEAFTYVLQDLVMHDEIRTMRLYAIQHLGMQRSGGRLEGDLSESIRSMLRGLSFEKNGDLAGMAIARLAEWDGLETLPEDVILDQAVMIAADETRATDVRVSALHAAAAGALPLSRELAVDMSQPVILRKAAISLIGLHGGESDFNSLERLATENSRLAQAARPALVSIRARLAEPNAPALIPF